MSAIATLCGIKRYCYLCKKRCQLLNCSRYRHGADLRCHKVSINSKTVQYCTLLNSSYPFIGLTME